MSKINFSFEDDPWALSNILKEHFFLDTTFWCRKNYTESLLLAILTTSPDVMITVTITAEGNPRSIWTELKLSIPASSKYIFISLRDNKVISVMGEW